MWRHGKAACCNTPGVLTFGWCYTPLQSTYMKCVVPTSKHAQLNSSGWYNTKSHPSVSVLHVYIQPLTVFLWRSHSEVSADGRGEVLVHKYAQTPAYLRCLVEVIFTVHCKHTHTNLRVHPLQKPRNSCLIVFKQKMAAGKRCLDRLEWTVPWSSAGSCPRKKVGKSRTQEQTQNKTNQKNWLFLHMGLF